MLTVSVVVLAAPLAFGAVALHGGAAGPGAIDLPAFLASLVLATAARVFAFRVYGRARIALDTPIYVATVFAAGALAGALLVWCVLSGEGLWRYLKSPPKSRNLGHLLSRLHGGAVPALVVLGLGIVFPIEAIPLDSALGLGLGVPVFAAILIAIHYVIAGGMHWLGGSRTRTLVRQYFGPVVGVELALAPVAVAMVSALRDVGLWLYLLIGTLAVSFSAVYRRLTLVRADLNGRLRQLTLVNGVAHELVGSLNRRELFEKLAQQLLGFVDGADRVVFAFPDSEHGTLEGEVYGPGGEWLVHGRPDSSARALGEVYDSGERAFRLDRAGPELEVERTRRARWLGLPLVSHDVSVGVMAIEVDRDGVFEPTTVATLETIADVAAIAIENARLFELATIDGLTGLFVRRHFDQRLQEEWQRARRYSSDFSVGMLDLDHFKRVNDVFGHQTGDRVLRGTAEALRQCLRKADIAGRYGGEEFAFLLPRTGPEEARAVAERMRRDVAARSFDSADGEVRVTASIGLVTYPHDGAANAEDLVAIADQALYRAKQSGRNRVVVAGDPDDVEKEAK